ncbi:MAG: hypothetical protein GY866_01590 [Proteobacteria bacterium]|nr:hypothetical protein [Pseudomonadota bacterium]
MQSNYEHKEPDRSAGSLYLKLDEPYGEEIRISDWEHGFEIQTKSRGRWIQPLVPPDIVPFGSGGETDPLTERFRSLIPDEINDLTSCFRFRRLTLLRLVRENDGALDLLKANRVLLWLVVCFACEYQYSRHKTDRILGLKQIEILEFLFGYGTKAAVNFIRKIACRRFDERHFRILEKIVVDEELIGRLKHRPVVPANLLPTLREYEVLLNPKMLDYWVEKALENDSSCAREAEDFLALWNRCRLSGRVLRLSQMDLHMKNCGTPREVEDLMNSWEKKKRVSLNYLNAEKQAEQDEINAVIQARENRPDPEKENRKGRAAAIVEIGLPETKKKPVKKRKKTVRRKPGTFPPPPIPGNDLIQPITTLKELKAESTSQKNCVDSYKKKIQNGSVYIYRSVRPRATIEVKRTGGRLSLGQIKLSCNREPDEKLRQLVEDWFRRNRP